MTVSAAADIALRLTSPVVLQCKRLETAHVDENGSGDDANVNVNRHSMRYGWLVKELLNLADWLLRACNEKTAFKTEVAYPALELGPRGRRGWWVLLSRYL